MSKRTFNILIPSGDVYYPTLTEILPPSYVFNDNLYNFVVGEQLCSIVDGKAVCVIDLRITSQMDPPNYVGVCKTKGLFFDTVVFNHCRKSAHTAHMNAVANIVGAKHFHKLNTSSVGTGLERSSGLYVIKPEFGARGIGHIVFDSEEVTYERIDQALIEYSALADFENALKDVKTLRYISPREFTENAGYTLLRESRAVSSYVTNITNEYRAISGYDGDVVYTVPRSRNKHADVTTLDGATLELCQATGSNEPLSGGKEGLPIVNGFKDFATHAEEISKFMRKLALPLHSFDFYFTADGMWGIFEFNQNFGTNTIPKHILGFWTKKYIERLCLDIKRFS